MVADIEHGLEDVLAKIHWVSVEIEEVDVLDAVSIEVASILVCDD